MHPGGIYLLEVRYQVQCSIKEIPHLQLYPGLDVIFHPYIVKNKHYLSLTDYKTFLTWFILN